jgi:hypothetical protein
MLLQIARQPTDDEMREFVYKIGTSGLTRDQARDIRQGKPQKERNFSYHYEDPSKTWSLTLKFRNPDASSEEVADALRTTLASLES